MCYFDYCGVHPLCYIPQLFNKFNFDMYDYHFERTALYDLHRFEFVVFKFVIFEFFVWQQLRLLVLVNNYLR